MKKNIILLLFVLIIGFSSLEFYASIQVSSLIKRNGFTKELIDFYDIYYRDLHHLGRLNEADANNPSSLIFEELGNGKKSIIIQGDSWAEQYRLEKHQKHISNYINKQGNYKFILAGTGSYSPSIMTSQLNLLRNEFYIDPNYIIAIIDQTDIGDELCRYRNLREEKDGKIIVKPEPKSSLEPNASFYLIENFKMFFSNSLSLYKVFYYFKNLYTYKNIQKNYKVKCDKYQILNPLENGIQANDKEYIINIFEDYFDEVFSNKNLKKLIIVTHPHKNHLTGKYILNIETLINEAIKKSIYKKNIKTVSFFEEFKNYSMDEINNMFIEGDPYSHLQDKYFLQNILHTVLNEIN